MIPSRSSLLLGALLFSPWASASAQSDFSQDLVQHISDILAPTEFQSVVVGDFDQNGTADSLSLFLQELVVSFDVASFAAPFVLKEPTGVPRLANAVATHSSSGEIFTLGYRGLTTLLWDDSANDFLEVSLLEGAWLDGQQLRFVPGLYGDSGSGLIALDATGTSILILQEVVPGFWVEEPSILLTETATDLTEVQWTGSGSNNPLEFCYATTSGIRVVDLAGNLLYFRGTTLTSHVARSETSSALDRIEWLSGPTGNGTSYITSVTPAGVLTTGVIPNASASGLVTGDINGDGLDDIVATFSDKVDLLLVEGGANNMIFSTHEWINGGPISLGGPAASALGGGHQTVPFLRDIAHEGKASIVMPTLLQAGVLLTTDLELAGWAYFTIGLGVDPDFDMAEPGFCQTNNSELTGILTLEFDYATTEATQFDVSVFVKLKGEPYMEPVALSTCPLPVHPDGSYSYTTQSVIPKSDYGNSNGNDDLYFIVVDPVNSAGQTVSRRLVYNYSASSEAISMAHAMDGWTEVVVIDATTPCAGDGDLPNGISAGGLSKKRTAGTPPQSPPRKVATCKEASAEPGA